MKFGITSIGREGRKTSSVTFRRYFETAVTASDAVDPETSDREVRTVLAHDRDVGAVERRHDAEAPGRQHLAGEMGRNRVRESVVGVQEVEALVLRHVDDPRRESEVVRRVLEERIRRDRHLVVAHPVA